MANWIKELEHLHDTWCGPHCAVQYGYVQDWAWNSDLSPSTTYRG